MAWTALPNSTLATALPSPPAAGSPNAIINAWSTGVFDALRNQFLICAAGGHGDYAGNECYAFRHATETWTRLTDPSPNASWSIPSGDPLSDGTPDARHTYGGVGLNPADGKLYLCGGSRWYDGNPTTLCWTFDPVGKVWTNLGVVIDTSWDTGGTALFRNTTGVPWMAWDTRTQKFLTSSWSHYARVNFSTLQSEIIGCGPVAGMTGRNAVLDPDGNALYMVGKGETRRFDLSQPPTTGYCPGGSTDITLVTTGATEIQWPPIEGSGALGLVWDPVARLVVAYGATADGTGGRAYTFDPSTFTWRAWEAAGVVPPAPTPNGVWNRLWLSGECLYVVTQTNNPTYRACGLPWRGSGPPPAVPPAPAGLTIDAGATPPPIYDVTLATAGTGGGTVSASGSVSARVPASARALVASALGYAPGATVNLTATPAAGSTFFGWSGDSVCAPSFAMPPRDVACTGVFVSTVQPGGLTVTWTAVPRTTGNSPTPVSGQAKHMRMAYDPASRRVILVGGDHYGVSVGDGNGQPSVWATAGGGTWQMLMPPCQATGLMPARPDNVIWAVDAARNRGVLVPGFFFGIAKAQAECPGPDYRHTAMVLPLSGATAWALPPWPPFFTPQVPPSWEGDGYWGDGGGTWGAYDAQGDQLCTNWWEGNWGSNFACLSFATNTWTNRLLGSAPYDDALRNAYSGRMQPAVDTVGRMAYYFTPGNRLYRVPLDSQGTGTWISSQPSAACPVPGDTAQEGYAVFDTDHRAVLKLCVPSLGGEVIGVAAYFVDTNQWAWYPAPVDRPQAVMANAYAYSPACRCVIGTGGHAIVTANPARPPGTVLPDPTVDWQIALQ